MSKQEIRNKIKELKKQLTTFQVESSSDLIFKTLKEQISFEEYDAIYTYVSFNEEIRTSSIMEYAFSKKVKVAVPKIVDKVMNFYYISNMAELKIGYFGILEPTTDIIAKDHKILMIMPGLAFDEDGNRVGYGAGFYDKYLKRMEELEIHKVALAYDFQIVDSIEETKQDIKVDKIITPTRCIDRRKD